MNTFAIITALLGSSMADHCCGSCTDGKIKTYSVDHIFNECGEACMMEKDFWKYKIFEPGMKKAVSANATVCHDLGYSQYDKTDTHGVPGIISMTLDMFKQPKDLLQEKSIL